MFSKSEWMPTSELRFAIPPTATTKPPQLQQLWVRDGTDKFGHVIFAAEKEWRNVPLVVLDK